MTNRLDYVNRKKQINLLREALTYIRSVGGMFQTVHEYIGIPTIGKTTLIHMLFDVCRDQDVPCAHIDFDPQVNPSASGYKEEPSKLLIDLAAQLDVVKESLLDALDAYESSLPAVDEEARKRVKQKLVHAFRKQIEQLYTEDPAVFLFDTTDQAHPGVLSFLEEEIISPLTQKGRCLFVLAGRAAIHWNRFEVRRRVRTERLQPFDPVSIADQLEQQRVAADELEQLSTQIYHLTGGLPYGNFVVSRRLNALAEQGEPVDAKTFQGHKPELLDALIKDVIDHFVFRGVGQQYQEACYVLALVRQFDLILLRRLLSNFVPAFASYPRNAYGGLLGKLNATYLIEWDDTRKGYSVDPSLRRILGQFVRLHHPQRYEDVNREALAVYRDWIERVADYRSIYIVEALYHEACLACVEETCDFREMLESFDNYLDQYEDEDPELVGSMLQRLEMELREDLKSDELGSLGALLPDSIKKDLEKRVSERREQASYQSSTLDSIQRQE